MYFGGKFGVFPGPSRYVVIMSKHLQHAYHQRFWKPKVPKGQQQIQQIDIIGEMPLKHV